MQPVLVKRFLRRDVEGRHAAERQNKEREIDRQQLEPTLVVAHNHGRKKDDRKNYHQRIGDVSGEVIPGFQLFAGIEIASQDSTEHLLAGLHGALCPPALLGLKRIDLHRQFGGASHDGAEKQISIL